MTYTFCNLDTPALLDDYLIHHYKLFHSSQICLCDLSFGNFAPSCYLQDFPIYCNAKSLEDLACILSDCLKPVSG